MNDVVTFGWVLGAVGLAVTAALLSNRLGERIRIPAPALFLVGAAVASDLLPGLNALSTTTVQRIVTVALAMILFDGGAHIGWRRFRSAAAAVVWVGVAGTLVTAGAVALLAHYALGFDWLASLLVGTALAPTDPAVVFSVLGRREIVGRSGVILEGESGANDPVGIALMVALLSTAGFGSAGFGPAGSGSIGLGGASAIAHGLVEFGLQLVVGTAVGIGGGFALLWFMRRIALPGEGLYPLRTLACALLVYSAATGAHGSGFLAVFVAGIVLGDARAPYKREVRRFHASLASLSEIVAFTVLGLTVSLKDLPRAGAVRDGLVLAVVLALVIRPVLVGIVLAPVRLRRGERAFVLWSGLKGAVPVLLGTFAFTGQVPGAQRIYEIIFVVVTFSVIVQGGLVPLVARWCQVPMRTVEPEPWSLGMRFRHEPEGLHHYRVEQGAVADGCAIGDLSPGGEIWISLVNRDGKALRLRQDTELRAGDEILVLADPDEGPDPADLFRKAPPPPSASGPQATQPP